MPGQLELLSASALCQPVLHDLLVVLAHCGRLLEPLSLEVIDGSGERRGFIEANRFIFRDAEIVLCQVVWLSLEKVENFNYFLLFLAQLPWRQGGMHRVARTERGLVLGHFVIGAVRVGPLRVKGPLVHLLFNSLCIALSVHAWLHFALLAV